MIEILTKQPGDTYALATPDSPSTQECYAMIGEYNFPTKIIPVPIGTADVWAFAKAAYDAEVAAHATP